MVQLQFNTNTKEDGAKDSLPPVEKAVGEDAWIPAPPPLPGTLKPENIITVKSKGQCKCRNGKKACICCCTTFLFLFIGGVLTLGILFGLPRHWDRNERYGHCGVRWMDDEQEAYFEESVSLYDNEYEILNVPDISGLVDSYYEVIHDFNTLQTAIVNYEDYECYIKPLNESQVHPPETFWDVISGLADGEYLVDPVKIDEQYDVVYPGIEDYEGESVVITERCDGMRTYFLERADIYPYDDINILEDNFDWADGWEWKNFRETQGDSLADHHVHHPKHGKNH